MNGWEGRLEGGGRTGGGRKIEQLRSNFLVGTSSETFRQLDDGESPRLSQGGNWKSDTSVWRNGQRTVLKRLTLTRAPTARNVAPAQL